MPWVRRTPAEIVAGSKPDPRHWRKVAKTFVLIWLVFWVVLTLGWKLDLTGGLGQSLKASHLRHSWASTIERVPSFAVYAALGAVVGALAMGAFRWRPVREPSTTRFCPDCQNTTVAGEDPTCPCCGTYELFSDWNWEA